MAGTPPTKRSTLNRVHRIKSRRRAPASMTPSVKKASNTKADDTNDIVAQLTKALKDADCTNTLSALKSDLKKVCCLSL